ncbi:MAG: diacylglycerol kinase [Candidatus Moraniibacteriota bacterium]
MNRFSRSLYYAVKGIFFAIRNERNFQIEICAGMAVVVLMIVFPLSSSERSLVVLSVSLVLTLELANTALERVMDILKPRVHPYARVIKDVMAGAVLLASLSAIAIGIVIFSPYILTSLHL